MTKLDEAAEQDALVGWVVPDLVAEEVALVETLALLVVDAAGQVLGDQETDAGTARDVRAVALLGTALLYGAIRTATEVGVEDLVVRADPA